MSQYSMSRRQFLGSSLAAGAYALISSRIPIRAEESGRKLNVLFIAVDDLRPEIGCYGVPTIKTPNIDALAARGTLFNRCYCQQAVCSPSRTSLLTGLRPDTTKIYDLQTHLRKFLPEVITLPQQFKNNGYFSQGMGKLYHGGLDDPLSWSVPHWMPKAPAYGDSKLMAELREEAQAIPKEKRLPRAVERDPKTGLPLVISRPQRVQGPPWEAPNVPDNALADGMTADHAVATLRTLAKRKEPFFLGVGFLKPHLPFVAPKKYYDLYSPRDLSLADNPFPPKDCPEYALAHWGELRAYKGMPKTGPVTDKQALELIRGYYAAVSFTDAQIGKVVAELDRLELRDKTVIVLWGDHGWQLGEHGAWCKHTNFEVATRSPLIISAPGQRNPGAKTDALSEFVDIYPTLCDLCGVPAPDNLEGRSLVPVMNEPSRAWKKAAFSQYPRGKVMGHSMRTDRYRYTEWAEPGKEPEARELYDHKTDPDENVNIANLPENKNVVTELSKQLKAGWRAALP